MSSHYQQDLWTPEELLAEVTRLRAEEARLQAHVRELGKALLAVRRWFVDRKSGEPGGEAAALATIDAAISGKPLDCSLCSGVRALGFTACRFHGGGSFQ